MASRPTWTRVPFDSLVVFFGTWVLATLLLVWLGPLTWLLGASIALPGAVVLAAICPSSRFLVRGRALSPQRRVATFVSLVAAGGVAGGVSAALSTLLWVSFRELDSARVPLLLAGSGVFFYVASALYYAARLAEQEASDAQKRSLAASLRAREAELLALTARVNPHFLFNSLTSIAALTTRDPEGARKMSLDLATLLRDRLGEVNEWVQLGEELTIARLYLNIEQVRFADRLRVEEDVDPSLLWVPVPKLILQPLVENAVKHGIAGSDEGGVVRISVQRTSSGWLLSVESPLGRRISRSARGGLGQNLVRRRLAALYDGAASVEFGPRADRYLSTLALPSAASLGEAVSS